MFSNHTIFPISKYFAAVYLIPLFYSIHMVIENWVAKIFLWFLSQLPTIEVEIENGREIFINSELFVISAVLHINLMKTRRSSIPPGIMYRCFTDPQDALRCKSLKALSSASLHRFPILPSSLLVSTAQSMTGCFNPTQHVLQNVNIILS